MSAHPISLSAPPPQARLVGPNRPLCRTNASRFSRVVSAAGSFLGRLVGLGAAAWAILARDPEPPLPRRVCPVGHETYSAGADCITCQRAAQWRRQ